MRMNDKFIVVHLFTVCLLAIGKEQFGTKCMYSCGNYIKLVEENVTSIGVERREVKAVFSFISETVLIYIMSREKYWHVIEHNYGPKAKSIGRKFINPKEEEARQWVENSKCKIGKICAPNSDCWGSGSDSCYSEETMDWVSERSFHYLNMWWTTEWRETCTMDWECKIISRRVPIHYNSEGEKFLVIDDEKIKIDSDSNDKLIEKKNFNVFIPQVPMEHSLTMTMLCFKHKGDLLCEGANEEMIKFAEGTKCAVLGPSKYCLIEGEFDKIRDFGANMYASVSDLNQVRDAFVVNQERDNYNNYVLSLKLRKIQRVLLRVIESVSKKNPQILDGVLGGNFFSRHLSDGVFEVCSCKMESSCEQREFHSDNVKFCGKDVKPKPLLVFDVNKTIDYSIDDIFKFQGKEAHIVDSLMEEEERGSEFQQDYENNSFWKSLSNFVDPFSWLSSGISYIALIISVLAYLKK